MQKVETKSKFVHTLINKIASHFSVSTSDGYPDTVDTFLDCESQITKVVIIKFFFNQFHHNNSFTPKFPTSRQHYFPAEPIFVFQKKTEKVNYCYPSLSPTVSVNSHAIRFHDQKKSRSNILTVHVPHMWTSISFNRIILTSTATSSTIPMQYVLLIPDFDVLNIHIYIYIFVRFNYHLLPAYFSIMTSLIQ